MLSKDKKSLQVACGLGFRFWATGPVLTVMMAPSRSSACKEVAGSGLLASEVRISDSRSPAEAPK